MKILKAVFLLFLTGVMATAVFAADEGLDNKPQGEPAAQTDLSQFVYSYGAVVKVSSTEIVLQEYDYDSDVEREVVYQLDSAIKLDGFKVIGELSTQDIVEVYYVEQDGKKIAKILHREIVEDENSAPEAM